MLSCNDHSKGAAEYTTYPLPQHSFDEAQDYVESLLSFIASSELFQRLCGGVHILEFLTKEPDLYETILPETWRQWFKDWDESDILDLLMREKSDEIEYMQRVLSDDTFDACGTDRLSWRKGPMPPLTLLDYIHSIRRHALDRSIVSFDAEPDGKTITKVAPLPQHVTVGMKPKKVHEVQNFAKYINNVATIIDESSPHRITHVVDFGSGQNYLGRALASQPYSKRVIALESKELNISGARSMDVTAKLAEKEKIMRNKKEYRQGLLANTHRIPIVKPTKIESPIEFHPLFFDHNDRTSKDATHVNGSIQYVETFIENGDLSRVIEQIGAPSDIRTSEHLTDPQLMVVSLHSCGNLLHHGLRSLVLNPRVKAVVMVGCCYNLVTERLGPPTYKLPSLRSANRRLDQTSCAYDPHGFPMSERFESYQHHTGHGIRFNITARMMAVQAPENWTAGDCESFFTKHFYRALLQRIFLDLGIVEKPTDSGATETSPRGWTGVGPPLTIGSLRKTCYTSFTAYVRGAVAKLTEDSRCGAEVSHAMGQLTDEDLRIYEERYRSKKKELSIIWTLMAFSASVVESAMVVDRWLYLKEQEEVKDCWVQTVFDYKQSPRNLVVVGIKR